MSGFNWEYDFEPDFPVHIFPFTVEGNRDGLHWHNYYEIGLCTRGVGKFVYLDKIYSANAGDLFVTNNFENHVAITQGDTSMEYLFLIFLPSFIAHPHGRPMDNQYLTVFNYKPVEFQNKIDSSNPDSVAIRTLLTEAYERLQENDEFSRLEVDVKVRQILLVLARHHAQNPCAQQEQGLINPKIQRAIRQLNNHYSERLTVPQVATQLSLNPSYFRHLFKECTQTSFKEYITHLRMSQARKLLLATDKSIQEILAEVGYTNASQFYRVFYNLSHMTPTDYRKHYRDDA
jgi:AraC-like DNA-binding protein